MTEPVNGKPQAVYDKDYFKSIKPKKEQETRSLFNQLWDEAAKLLDTRADASGDGVVDKDDLPLLQQLITNLQNGQAIIEKNIKKFTFDPEKIKEGLQTCEKNLKKVVEDITAGTYVSPEEQLEQYKKAQKAKEESVTKTTSSAEPEETDSQETENNKPVQNNNTIASGEGNSHDTEAACENWIKKTYGEVPNVHKYSGEEGDVAIEKKKKPETASKVKVKAANQKKHTREDFINDLIRNGYTKEHAEQVANENGIV